MCEGGGVCEGGGWLLAVISVAALHGHCNYHVVLYVTRHRPVA